MDFFGWTDNCLSLHFTSIVSLVGYPDEENPFRYIVDRYKRVMASVRVALLDNTHRRKEC